MIEVFVDTMALSEQYPLTPAQADQLVNYVVKSVAASFVASWEDIVVRELSGARQQYLNSILVKDDGQGVASVMLVGEFPNMIENGAPPFDMKENLLSGPKAKIGKNGARYNTIPFYMGTPTALEENFNGGIMPKEIYKLLKNRDVDTPLRGDEIKSPFNKRQVHEVEVKPKEWEVYEHKSSIYEGLTKKKDAVTGQNTFMTFRRVSDNSDPSSWIYPGLIARNFKDKALGELNKEVEIGSAIDNWLIKSGLA